MEGAKASKWLAAGYDLFAQEGLEGLQVERLARILGLNKSGFYHYFGDLESYCTQLLRLHQDNARLFTEVLQRSESIEPDFLHLLIEFKVPVMFQMQLTRMRNNAAFYGVAEAIHAEDDPVVSKLWSKYLGVENSPGLAMRYFDIVRDMFYSRITFQSYHYEFLRDLLGEAREVINQLSETKAFETDESLLKGVDDSV